MSSWDLYEIVFQTSVTFRASPRIIVKLFGYCAERFESLDGVRAKTRSEWPRAKLRVRIARPVPPVAPKRAIVLRVEVGVDIFIMVKAVRISIKSGWVYCEQERECLIQIEILIVSRVIVY